MSFLEGLKRYNNLRDLEGDETIPQEVLLEAYDEAAKSVTESADDFVNYIHHRDAVAAEIKMYINRAKAALKRQEEGTKRIRERAAQIMSDAGMTKVTGTISKISSRPTESVEVDDVFQLPDIYIKKKIDVSPDKVAIGKVLKGGGKVPGAHLVTKQTLYIK